MLEMSSEIFGTSSDMIGSSLEILALAPHLPHSPKDQNPREALLNPQHPH